RGRADPGARPEGGGQIRGGDVQGLGAGGRRASARPQALAGGPAQGARQHDPARRPQAAAARRECLRRLHAGGEGGAQMKDAEVEFYHLVRRRIEHEDSLTVNRLSWLVGSQSFLFTAYALTL